MLLKAYHKEVFRPECRPEARSVQCIAHLDEDIRQVLPYLNAVLGGFQYTKELPSVSFRVQGKLIAVHSRKIAVNALKDEAEGDKILQWLVQEINGTWERRTEIEPRFEGARKPSIMEILRLLPKTNCRECGQPTCMVFATQAAEGGRGSDDCPPLKGESKLRLQDYLGGFQFD